uniref:Retrovirus-related Pol polyprotein from transposon TNT 1-94 n=1 Tax=Tanacetum cinerariifolium TaxID=118510 RepID=A0A6L2P5S2_TANCI|nr:retrovirus-related Pol polyprotein from transposon TNT 1-94 [Tanacetum cinerariifolium]
MESLNPRVVTAAKLPILNPNELDLWIMRIEQYFLITNYSLWEVILNGDSPPPTRIINGAVQIITHTTVEQRLQKLISQLEILSENISQEDINLKFLRSLPSEWKTHTLIWRNKADLEEQSLDDLFNNLKIYEAKVKGSSPSSQNTPNIAFVSLNNTDSINESLNAAPSIFTASFKATVSTLLNVDSLSDAVIYSFFAKEAILPGNAYHQGTTGTKKLLEELSQQRVPKNAKNDRFKTGEGCHVIPPPCTRTFMPLKRDLVFTDDPTASESVDNVFNVESSINTPSQDMSKTLRSDAPIVEDWIFDSEDETETESVPKQKEPSFVKSTRHVKSSRESVKKVENVVPTAVLTRSRLVSLNAARPVPTAVTPLNVKSPRPVKHVVNKAYSPVKRPINQRTSTKNSNFNKKVTTVKVNKVNNVQGTKGNAKKASTNWVWKPKCIVLDHVSRLTSASITLKKFNYTDALDFEEINEGYVAFRGNPKGGKIFDKGKIKTGKLDFDDVYFVNELKFYLFSVSQMCDKKNNVLFIDTECVVLSSNYKLPNEIHILLRVLRENNMYNVDLKNVVPSGGRFLVLARMDYEVAPQVVFRCVVVILGVLNGVLVTKPHMKTPYELLLGRSPSIGFLRPFGCPVTILNTLDPLGKFDGKADEGFLVGYSVNNKAFKVFNSRTRIVQETLHINFLKNKPNVAGIRPKWLFDIDTFTMSMNYQPVVTGNQPNDNAGIKENLDVGKVKKETVSTQQYVLLPLWSTGLQDPQNTDDDVIDSAFDVKENETDAHVSTNGSDKTANQKHDEKAK